MKGLWPAVALFGARLGTWIEREGETLRTAKNRKKERAPRTAPWLVGVWCGAPGSSDGDGVERRG